MYKLIDKTTREEIKIGDTVKDFRGEPRTIKGFRAPDKPSSTGRIYVGSREFFPSVINAQIVEVSE